MSSAAFWVPSSLPTPTQSLGIRTRSWISAWRPRPFTMLPQGLPLTDPSDSMRIPPRGAPSRRSMSRRRSLTRSRHCAHTAEHLFLHQNTVRYRIAKVEAILGETLTEPKTVTNVTLALYEDILEAQRQLQLSLSL